jgi:type IX secretion system PorP/SprF family membrane protein
MNMNISITGVVFCLLTISGITAQDVHLSQYQFDRLQVSPALTGMFNGDKQAALVHKQQYFSVPVDYMTFSGSYDVKFRDCYDETGFFSGGVLFNYDQSGDSRLSLASLSLNGSYTLPLTKSFFVGGGAYLGVGQRSFSEQDLEWDSQWDGTVFNPQLPSGETFSKTSFTFLDLGLGANIRLQGDDRTKLDAGIGAFHLNEPKYSFYDNADSITLPIRLSFYGLGILKVFDILDIYANGLYQDQGPYSETVLGGGVIIHLSNRKAREVELHLGAAVRLDDAVIPMFALGYDGWKGGFSYDITTSAFEAATDGDGGPEFFLTYTFKKLCPLKQTKVCTIF